MLGDYFKAKRGIATGGNSFFIRSRSEWHQEGISDEWLSPILPSPRNFHLSEVTSDESGWPRESDTALLNIPKSSNYASLPSSVQNYLNTCPEKSGTDTFSNIELRGILLGLRLRLPLFALI